MRLIDADALIERMKNTWDMQELYLPVHFADFVEDQPTVNQWISVKDRLPKKPDGYPYSEIRRSYFLVALESGCVESLGFDFDRMEWHYTGSPVTHWMPLPTPPEVNRDED